MIRTRLRAGLSTTGKPRRGDVFRLATGAAADMPALPPAMAASKTITFCAAMTLPPVIYINSDLKPAGVDVDFGNMLAQHLGVTAKWDNVAFASIIPDLVSGHCDAIVSALYIQAERLKVINELPYMYVSQSVLLKAGAPKLDSLTDLSGRKVAGSPDPPPICRWTKPTEP